MQVRIGESPIQDLDAVNQIHCCICGVMIDPNPSNTCIHCLKDRINVSEGIEEKQEITRCSGCLRFYNVNHWKMIELESADLMTLCLKTIKGLKNVKIVDSSFIWQEPNCKVVKVKIQIQRECEGVTLEKGMIITYRLNSKQCPDCAKSFTPHTWKAQVQLRQRVSHKRTLLFLEQLMLKHSVLSHCLNVEEHPFGINLYFRQKNEALKVVEFLQKYICLTITHSKELISHNEHTQDYNYKFSWSLLIPPLCKDDLLLLDPRTCKQLGGISPVVLCVRVATSIRVADLANGQYAELDHHMIQKHMPRVIMGRQELQKYVIVTIDKDADVGNSRLEQNKDHIDDWAEVEIMREEDGQTMYLQTHLGQQLDYNDEVLGYDLSQSNLDQEATEMMEKAKRDIPDVFLVKKFFERKKDRKRNWKLQPIIKEEAVADEEETKGKKKKNKQADLEERKRRDLEAFMNDIEEDPELKQHMNIYKEDRPVEIDSDDEIPQFDEGDFIEGGTV